MTQENTPQRLRLERMNLREEYDRLDAEIRELTSETEKREERIRQIQSRLEQLSAILGEEG